MRALVANISVGRGTACRTIAIVSRSWFTSISRSASAAETSSADTKALGYWGVGTVAGLIFGGSGHHFVAFFQGKSQGTMTLIVMSLRYVQSATAIPQMPVAPAQSISAPPVQAPTSVPTKPRHWGARQQPTCRPASVPGRRADGSAAATVSRSVGETANLVTERFKKDGAPLPQNAFERGIHLLALRESGDNSNDRCLVIV